MVIYQQSSGLARWYAGGPLLFVAAAGIILAAHGFAKANDADDPVPPRSEFASVCADLKHSRETYYGEFLLRDALTQLQTAAPGSRREIQSRLAAGYQLIKLGRPEDAVLHLDSVLEQKDLPVGLKMRALGVKAVAHLQTAEDLNCLTNHTADSCLLPIRAGGIHKRPDHARMAGDTCLAMIEMQKLNLDPRSVWLLNLSRMISGDFPAGVPERLRLPDDAFTNTASFDRWRDIAPDLGINVVDLAGGAIMDDFDGDGLLDLVSSTANPCDSLKAFRNDGRGGFEAVTKSWQLDAQLGGLNVIHADYDNDGDLDLLVLRGGWLHEHGRIRNSLLRNDLAESGTFTDVTRAAGLGEPALPTQTAAWADFDSDGDLDLYVGNEGPLNQQPYPSQLFENHGDGTFTDIAERAGVTNDRYTKGVAWGDVNNDGHMDLYVSTVASHNRLYINNGDGTFTDKAEAYGVTAPAIRSFATWFFDYDNDGWLDIFVGNYENRPEKVMASYFQPVPPPGQPMIYRNLAGKAFEEVSFKLGLRRPHLPMGANYGDLDNDGWLDFYLGTGEPAFEVQVPNAMYRNASGQGFEDVSFAGGFAHIQKGHGVAFGDIDNDGDQDLFHQLGGFYPGDTFANALFQNPGTRNNWLTLRLRGDGANYFGVGARLVLTVSDGETARDIELLAGSGGSFGGSSMQQEVGLGNATRIERLKVIWPGTGSQQVFTDLEPNRIYSISEDSPLAKVVALPVLTFETTPGKHRH